VPWSEAVYFPRRQEESGIPRGAAIRGNSRNGAKESGLSFSRRVWRAKNADPSVVFEPIVGLELTPTKSTASIEREVRRGIDS
jgi:hypothetical protein